MQDELQNSALKRGIGNAFSTKSLLDYEHDVEDTIVELTESIHRVPEFDLFQVIRFYQLDFLTKVAFGENLGHLQKRQDV